MIKLIKRNPFIVGGLVSIVIASVLYLFSYGTYAVFAIITLLAEYIIILIISFLLKKLLPHYRVKIEAVVLLILVLIHIGLQLNSQRFTEVYFGSENEPFSGPSQPYIIVFDIDNEPILENNYFSNHKIRIPKDGVLLTNSNTSDYLEKYKSYRGESDWTSNIPYMGVCDCYGKQNFRFNYVYGELRNGEKYNPDVQDSVLNNICEMFESGKLKGGIGRGYEKGNYLEQTEISINSKQLHALPRGLIELKNLEKLNLHTNKFTSIPREVFSFKKLKELSIGYNQIDSIPLDIAMLTALERLYVSGNNLSSLPDTLLTLPNLKLISVRGNNFEGKILAELYEKYKAKGIELRVN